jgi:hypothetical protein
LADVTAATNRRLYLVAAVVVAVMTSVFAVWCFLHGVTPRKEIFQLYTVITGILVVSWLVTDPGIPAMQRPSFDYGMLVWATFPLLAAYHMFTAHRWRGILIVLGLFGLLVAPDIALAIAYAIG